MDLLGSGCGVLLFSSAASLLLSKALHVLSFVFLSPWFFEFVIIVNFYLSTLASYITVYRFKLLTFFAQIVLKYI